MEVQESSQQRGQSERVDAIVQALRILFTCVTFLLDAAEQRDPNSVARDISQRLRRFDERRDVIERIADLRPGKEGGEVEEDAGRQREVNGVAHESNCAAFLKPDAQIYDKISSSGHGRGEHGQPKQLGPK